MFMMMFRLKTRFAGWAAMLGLILVMPLTLPTSARAAGTTDWRCNIRADGPRTLAPSDLGRPDADRRVYDLDCTFTATTPGPSPVTLCVSAPEGENAGGGLRQLKRRGGKEMIAYRLTARTGDVPGAVSFPMTVLGPMLTPVYTLMVGNAPGNGDVEGSKTFRQQLQLAFLTEFQGMGTELVASGEYEDTLTGLVISIHEGTDCGLLLWGPPNDSLGTAANFTSALKAGDTCALIVTSNVNFGTVSTIADFQSTRIATGGFVLQCVAPVTYTIGLDNGNNFTGRLPAPRNMASGTNRIPYELLKPDRSAWGNVGLSTVQGSVLSSPSNTPFVVTGRIMAGTVTTLPPPGTYLDTVVIRASF